METASKKMQIEIWSDVMCPFCYIGKRKFETALGKSNHSDEIEVVWKSFQLAPDMKTDPNSDINHYLAKHKGISLDEAKGMKSYVTDLAKKVGLTYNFDKSVLANSFKAHQFTHFAKQHGKQLEAEELLFKSYFTDGLNIDSEETLMNLAKQIGLNAEELKASLAKGEFADAVRNDIYEAQQVGVRGVPFFVLDRKYAISGAQEVQTFENAINTSFKEWKEAVNA